MKNDSISVLRRSLLYVIAMLLLFGFSAAMAGQPEAWKADWDKTVEAAKKEGQIVLYGSADFETLYAEFHKKYPEIRVTGVFGRGADVAKRLMSERRAEKYLADLYVNGQTTGYNVFYKAKALDPIPPLLVLPEVADVSKWWQGKHHYVDPENQYLLNINGETRIVVGYNSKLVNPAEIKSYWDLLNPKWKGKIVAYDPNLGLGGCHAVFLLSQEPRAGVYQADSHGDRYRHQQRYASDGGLVGGREICNLDFRAGLAHGFGRDADAGIARELVRA